MYNLDKCEDRLKTILVADKKENPKRVEKIIKAEILYVLKNYFELVNEDLTVDISINDQGRYELNINAISRAIKVVKSFN